jgi:hypothetical protein
MKKVLFIIAAIATVSIVSAINLYHGNQSLKIDVPIEDMKGKLGRVEVEVLDVDDEVIGRAYKYIYVTSEYHSVKFDVELKKEPEDRDLLRVKVEFKKQERIFSLYQLEDRMVVSVMGQDEFIRGTPIRYRIIVRNQRNNAPIDNARVEISLKIEENSEVVFMGSTDRSGACDTEFHVPEEIDAADLRFSVHSYLGRDTYDTSIRISSGNVTYVITDKPIYQPGQTIHIRSLSLRRPDLHAVKEQTVVYEVEDSKGNKVFKKEILLDDFGIGYAKFLLADEVNHGDYVIRAILDGEKVEKTVNVKRYVLPKFMITLATDKEYYMPGGRLQGDVDVQYFFGKPVVQGQVKVTVFRYDIGFNEEAVIEGVTDEDGHYRLVYDLPAYFVGQPLEKGDAFLRFDIEVIDPANHSEKISVKKKVVRDLINLAVVPEGGVLKPNIENRIYVFATYPDGTPCIARTEMRVNGRRLKATTDAYGIAQFEYTPRDLETNIEVSTIDDKGESAHIERTFKTTSPGEQIAIRMGRGIYKVGESITFDLLTTKRSGRAYLDVVKDNQTILTKSIVISNGRGRVNLNTTPDMSGSIWLHAYVVTQGSNIVRDTRFCFVHAADELAIDISPDQDSYEPGQDGRIVFTVTDQSGKPRVAALCVAIVDEAVFAVSELKPGLEKVYFMLEEEIMKPRYEIHEFTPIDIVEKKKIEARAENLMFSTLTPKDHYSVSYTTPQLIDEKIKTAYYPQLEEARRKIYEAQNAYFQKHGAYPEADGALAELVQEELLKEKDLLDPWGRRYYIHSPEERFIYFTIVSAGPDGIIETGDDISEMMWREKGILAAEIDAALPRAAVGARREDVQSKMPAEELEQKGEEPRVREFFPETFVFEPALITDHRGIAQLGVTMPDAITTWRITSFASSSSGQLGSQLAQLRVFQDFFVDIDLPVALTAGDEISIPIALYNYLPREQQVKLILQEDDWFELMVDNEITKTLQKNEVGVVYFPIRVKQIGYHAILVRAYGEVKSDAIKRSVTVLPDGKLFERIISDRLSGKVVQTVTFPQDAIEEANWLGLKIFPGIFSQIVEGLDNLLGVPFGCFEQTTSITYPNILVLDYMRQTEQIKPETEMKAEEYISLGYQRLLTFEVPAGGFSWFGEAPANRVLTAYGLMMFNDMTEVYDIDERLIERTAQWLRNQQNKGGYWSPDSQYLHAESWTRIQNNEILPTAYICWGLGEIGDRGNAVQSGLNYLRKNLKAVDDPYMLALVANAFVAIEPNSATTAEVLKKLVSTAVKEKDVVYWESNMSSITFTRGKGADIEATGLAVYALIKAGKYGDIVTDALTYLIRSKDQCGMWYTTQGTVIALRSLVAALGGISEDIEAKVMVMVNGNKAADLDIDQNNADLMHQIDLSQYVKKQNTIEIRLAGEGNFLYEVVSKYYLPWEIVPRPQKSPFDISVDYDRTKLAVNDIVDVDVKIELVRPGRAEMVIVDLFITP